MIVAVLKENHPNERRVALIPSGVAQLSKAGCQVLVQSGAGVSAGFSDQQFLQSGAKIVNDRQAAFDSEVVLQVRSLGANLEAGRNDLEQLSSDQLIIGMCDPLGEPQAIADVARTGASQIALELIPRISRAQSMDVLSSMATIAGYRAVLLAAVEVPRLFPLLMTAAGTLSPARVFVIGAGVAGLQAIATARRLGAVVNAYDVRPAVREQVESLGAKFVEMELDTAESEDTGGYAKTLDETFYQKQRELMSCVVAESDVVITTAAIPGKNSPQLITADAVTKMKPGSVIVDLAAERGGNCELTQADQVVHSHEVTILGPTNLPSEVPTHASQMFSKNITTLLDHLIQDGNLLWDFEDEITRETVVARAGQIVHPTIRESLGLEPLVVSTQPKNSGQNTSK